MKSVVTKSALPWWWIPTLYFAEGIPYFIVNNISVIMFAKMGVPNETMSLYTSLLYLPWVIKPFWSPFVDIIKTKRWWIILMQIVMSISFIALVLSLPHPSQQMIASKNTPVSMFTVMIILFYVTAIASATHDIAADGYYMLALKEEQQTFFVGIRSTFYRLSSIFGKGVLVMIAGLLELRTGNIPLAWSSVMAIAAIIFSVITIYHLFVLPAPDADYCRNTKGGADIAKEFADAFVGFFKKKGIIVALAFMLLYRFSEALMLKLVDPFFLDPVENGGLGISTAKVGFINGTVGIVAMLSGGIAGGIAASKWGLKKVLWPMALSLTLPCFVYVYMSVAQPSNLWLINACVAFEQLGYGFGFQAYMLYLIYFSAGEFKTSHYAICTGFMALGMMIPGIFAGYIWKWLGGYIGFFWFVMLCCLVTVVVTMLVKIDPEYGKKNK
ncbi:MAG: MFS transporter [Candidatus Cryptobacteroides sp.]